MKKSFFAAALLSVLVSGCSTSGPAAVLPLSSPADTEVGIRPARHIDILEGYNHRDVVDPRPWRTLNDEQSPNKGGHQ